MSESDPSSVAGRWFALRVHHAPSRLRKTAWALTWPMLYVMTLGFYLAPFREPGTILVIRRSDGFVSARLDFDQPAALEVWVQDLLRDLLHQHVFDFCRDLRVPINLVEGGGQNYDAKQLVSRVRATTNDSAPSTRLITG